MKGYWHIVALSASAAAISIILGKNLFFFLFLWLVFLYIDQRLQAIPLLLSITTFLFFFHYLPAIDPSKIPVTDNGTRNFLQGTIITSPVIQSKKVELIIEDSSVSEKVLVVYFPGEEGFNREDTLTLRHGAECIVRGKVEVPEGARNPGEFDYRKFLLTKDIRKQIVVNDLAEISCDGTSFWERFFSLRSQLMTKASENISDFTASWVNALVLGDDSLIDGKVITLFQDWGLSHILAISGLHIGIVVGLVYFMLVKTNAMTKEKAEIVMLLFLPVYTVIAGGEPSVLRASSMVLLFLILRRMKITVSATDVISIVFLLILLADPYLIYHIGFQFSFMVTFGIILSRKWLALTSSPIYQLLIISFISQMVILPFQLNYFSFFQPLSILLNLIIVPYFSLFVIPYMFLLLLFTFLPESFLYTFDMLFVAVHYRVIQVVEWVDRYFDYPLYLSDLPVWFFILYYLCLLVALISLEKGHLKESFIGFSTLTILLTSYAAMPYFSDKGSVTMLDIGQGDAFIIELPYREGVIMIDAGARLSFEDKEPSETVYERIIKPYMRTNGIYEIDALFLTHEDIDHIGSAQYMVEDEVVNEIYVSGFFQFPESLFQKINDKKIPVHRVEAGETVDAHGHLFTVLAPSADKQKANENSLVLYSIIGGERWLFTGDISVEEELEMIEKYQFQADIIKIAHHGSNTSSDPKFLKSIKTQTAMISVGKDNAYGHPTSEVIETLEELGVQVFRTDEDGAVQYKFQAGKGTFQTFLEN